MYVCFSPSDEESCKLMGVIMMSYFTLSWQNLLGIVIERVKTASVFKRAYSKGMGKPKKLLCKKNSVFLCVCVFSLIHTHMCTVDDAEYPYI